VIVRVAALYDIHGNLPALEAVLARIHTEGVDLIVVGGDVVPGPMPDDCLALLMGLTVPVRFIRGNGDADVVARSRGGDLTRVPGRFHPMMGWVADRMSAPQVEEMASWPLTTTASLPILGNVLFCHATPRDDGELITRLTPEGALREALPGVSADVVVCGHTHMPFDRTVGGTRIVNAGSVGLPYGEPGAHWLCLGPGIEARRTAYDLEAAQARIRRTGYPLASEFEIRRPPAESEMVEMFEAARARIAVTRSARLPP
jgi:putative phosphoesterase